VKHRARDIEPEHHDRLARVHLGADARDLRRAAGGERDVRGDIPAPEIFVQCELDQSADGGNRGQAADGSITHRASSIHAPSDVRSAPTASLQPPPDPGRPAR
jgi:hypothetical protein